MHIVKHVAYLGGYTTALTFEDGDVKIVNLKPHLTGEIFQPLRAPEFFARFTLNPDTDTITWPNGADFSPDWLCQQGIDASTLSHSA